MRKQFTYFMTIAVLSMALVGCNSDKGVIEETIATEAPVETAPTSEEILENNSTEITVSETKEESVEEETTKEETVKEEGPEDTSIVETITSTPASKPQASTSTSTSKPQTSTSTSTSKPQTNTSTSTSKPQTSTNASTSKPQASTSTSTSKPQTSTSTSTSKPQTSTSTSTSEPQVTLSASEVFDKVVAGVDMPDTLEVDSEMIQDIYHLDTSILKSYRVGMPTMSGHITEVAIFEVKDPSDIATVTACIDQRGGDINPRYLYPSLQDAYENRQTVVQGNYIFFAMEDSIDELIANFKAAVK